MATPQPLPSIQGDVSQKVEMTIQQLWTAIQDLQRRNTELERRVAALESS